MKKINVKKPNKIVISSTITIIIVLVVSLAFIYKPFLNKCKTLRSSILQERDRNLLIGKIRALGRHLKVYEKRIPQKGRGVSWLLSQISEMAAEESIEIISIKPGMPEGHRLYTKVYVILDTASTYHQLGRFVSRVESAEKFFRVESINIKRLDIDKDFSKETARLKPFDVKANIVINTVIKVE